MCTLQIKVQRGCLPVKAFPLRIKNCNAFIFPMPGGNEPDNSLDDMYNICKFSRWWISGGITPAEL